MPWSSGQELESHVRDIRGPRNRAYHQDMRLVIVTALILAATGSGQTHAKDAGLEKLTASLTALKDRTLTQTAHRDRIAADINALAEENHPPSTASVGILAHDLARTLAGKALSSHQLSDVASDIRSVLHSAGVGAFKLQQALSRFEDSIRSLGVSATDAESVAADLAAIGKEVRGPEGVPSQPLR